MIITAASKSPSERCETSLLPVVSKLRRNTMLWSREAVYGVDWVYIAVIMLIHRSQRDSLASSEKKNGTNALTHALFILSRPRIHYTVIKHIWWRQEVAQLVIYTRLFEVLRIQGRRPGSKRIIMSNLDSNIIPALMISGTRYMVGCRLLSTRRSMG